MSVATSTSLMLMAERAFAKCDRLSTALREIEDMPVSMVNNSESLRHSIKAMQQIARIALTSQDRGEK